MYQTDIFTKTRKEAPKDEVSKNASLLIRGGYIHKEMAGVYSYLPLGLRVLEKINSVIREEMNGIGGQELLLSSLQSKELWQSTDRWDDEKVDTWFKTKLKNGTDLGLAFTHEEPITALMKDYLQSFRDLPVYAYQLQTKFRNETRAKSGILRTREFLMKDLYSFCKDEEEHNIFYEKAKEAYKNIFTSLGIGDKTYLTYASGGSFSKYSHEFQTITDAGEDTIHVCDNCSVAVNEEIIKDEPKCPVCKGDLSPTPAVEVGNIFTLGTRFSEAIGLNYVDEANTSKPVFMGSYGIGPGRLIGVLAEIFSDDKGIKWPFKVAPFPVHVISLGNSEEVLSSIDSLHNTFLKNNIEILVDNRDLRAGEKFADSDLIGIPFRVIVSDKTVSSGKLEVVNRISGETLFMNEEELLSMIKTQ